MSAWTCEVVCTKCPYRAVVFSEPQQSIGDPIKIGNIPKRCPVCSNEVQQTLKLGDIPFKATKIK